MASAGPAWPGIARCGHGGYPPSIIPSTPETSIAFAPTDRPDPPSPRIIQNRLNTSMTDSPASREVLQYPLRPSSLRREVARRSAAICVTRWPSDRGRPNDRRAAAPVTGTRGHGAEAIYSRTLHLLVVEDGQIAEHIVQCTGPLGYLDGGPEQGLRPPVVRWWPRLHRGEQAPPRRMGPVPGSALICH